MISLKKYIFILFCAFPLLFVACERSLKVPLPEHDAKLVINSFLDANKPLDVYVSRSFDLLESRDQDFLINDAEVELFEGDESLGMLMHRDTVIYDSLYGLRPGEDTVFVFDVREKKLSKYTTENVNIQPGKSYRIEVSHNFYDDAAAVTTAVHSPELLDVKLDQNVVRRVELDFNVFQSLLRLKLKDTPNEKNFYLFKLELELSNVDPSEERTYQWTDVAGPAIQAESGFKADTPWLTDEGKDGQTLEVDLLTYLPNAYLQANEIEDLDIKTLILKVYSVNEEAYNYLNKLDNQRNGGDEFSIFPSEAIVVNSNIDNGYGIFGGVNLEKHRIEQ